MGADEGPYIVLYTETRKSPFFSASARHRPRAYAVVGHTYHPRHYGDPVAEYWHLVTGVTLWDVGVERQIEISGPDAFAFTNMLTCRDLTRCGVGQCRYVFLTAPDGGIVNDPVLLRLREDRFWLSMADADLHLWVKGVAYGGRFNVEVRELDVAPVQVQGPRSREVMGALFGQEVLDLPYYRLVETRLDHLDVVVSRTGYSGEVGYEIYLKEASRHAQALWDRVLEAGRPFDLQVTGPCHIRRIEAGMLAYYADMWLDTNPLEVGDHYAYMVELEQEADFIGKAALKRIAEEGVKRKLVGVEIGGEPLGAYVDNQVIDFLPVRVEGRQVGKVTSACWSPRLEKNIGYAMLPVGYANPGQELEVETPRSGRVRAVTVPLPHWDPERTIPRS